MTDNVETPGTGDTSLPDQLERIGVVLGATLLLSLPMGVLGLKLLENGRAAWQAAPLVFGPGFVVGVLVATGRLQIQYRRLWVFSLTSWIATLAIFGSTGSSQMTADGPFVVAYWAVGLLVGAAFTGRKWLRARLF